MGRWGGESHAPFSFNCTARSESPCSRPTCASSLEPAACGLFAAVQRCRPTPLPPDPAAPDAGRLEEAERLQLAEINFASRCELKDAYLDQNTPAGGMAVSPHPRCRCCCCSAATVLLALPRITHYPSCPHTEACFVFFADELALLEENVRVTGAGLQKLAAAARGER